MFAPIYFILNYLGFKETKEDLNYKETKADKKNGIDMVFMQH